MGAKITKDNYINITGDPSGIHQRDKNKGVASKNNIFSKPVIIKKYTNRIEFLEHTSTSVDKPVTFGVSQRHKNGETWYSCRISAELLPLGKIEFDEDESEEGKLVFYYEDVQ